MLGLNICVRVIKSLFVSITYGTAFAVPGCSKVLRYSTDTQIEDSKEQNGRTP